MKSVSLLVATALLCLISGLGRAEDKVDYAKMVVGKWEVTKADAGTVPPGALVEFTKDGKLKVAAKKGDEEVKIDGTYTVEKNKLTMIMKIGTDEKKKTITIVKVTEKVMSTKDEDDKTVELKKAK